MNTSTSDLMINKVSKQGSELLTNSYPGEIFEYLTLNEDFNKIVNEKEYATTLGLKVISFNGLHLIKYIRDKIDDDNRKTLGKFRSIVLDNEFNIVCYSPPKTLNNKGSRWWSNNNLFEYTNMVDGTMINMFWNKYNNDWELCTKSNIGANCMYNTNDTFRYMFLDAMNTLGIELSEFNKDIAYSFVLQHPKNRIVDNITEKAIYIIDMYRCIGNEVFRYNSQEGQSIYDACYEFDKPKDECFNYEYSKLPKNISRLKKLNIKNMSDIKFVDFNIPGIMIQNIITGERIKYRNEKYEEIRRLKGNSNKLQFTYFSLRRDNLLGKYIKYFPENKEQFNIYTNELYNFTDTLFSYYIQCFIHKEKHIKLYPYEYIPHLSKLHDIYLNNLRVKKMTMNKRVVINYIKSLEPQRLMFSINYKKYNKNKEKKD